MTAEELHDVMREGEIIFMDDPSYKSENLRVLSGYTRYGDKVYQISRSIFDFNFGIVDIQIFLSGQDVQLVEIRGINLYEDGDTLINPGCIDELVVSIYEFYDPEIKYTPNKIFKLIKEYFVGEDGCIECPILSTIKDRIFVHNGTFLGIKADYFDDNEFVNIFEDYKEYMDNKVKEYKEKDKISESILDGNPIYEIISSEGEYYEEDDKPNPSGNHIGLYFDKNLDKIIQFTKDTSDGYKCNIEYYFYDNLGNVSIVVYINNISKCDVDKYKIKVLDKNYISKDRSSLNSDGDFIKLLFSDIDDEDFSIRNWEKVEVDRNPKEIDVKSYDKDIFISSLGGFES